MSIESDESIPEENLMADARCTGRKDEFFRINSGVDPKVRLINVRIVVDNFSFIFVFLSNG